MIRCSIDTCHRPALDDKSPQAKLCPLHAWADIHESYAKQLQSHIDAANDVRCVVSGIIFERKRTHDTIAQLVDVAVRLLDRVEDLESKVAYLIKQGNEL